jgi:hypothetical protein
MGRRYDVRNMQPTNALRSLAPTRSSAGALLLSLLLP